MIAALVTWLALAPAPCPGDRQGPSDRHELAEEIVLHPVAGAPAPELPVLPRYATDVLGNLVVLEGLEEPLRGCYRWARFRTPALRSIDLWVTLTIDARGRVTELAPEAAPAEAKALSTCVKDVLTGRLLGEYTPRLTEVRLGLRFTPSGLARPAVAPPRPRHHAEGCASTELDLPRDRIEETTSILSVTD